MAEHDPTDINELARRDKRAEDAEQSARSIEASDTKWIMSDKRGRRFIHRILERSGVWRLSFNTNALTMAFAEGTRNEGLRLVAMLTDQCPELYTLMLKEQKENGRRNNAGQRD